MESLWLIGISTCLIPKVFCLWRKKLLLVNSPLLTVSSLPKVFELEKRSKHSLSVYFGNFLFVFLWVFVFWYLVDRVLLIMLKVGQMERALSLILSYHALGNPPLFSAHWVLYLRNIILHRGDYQLQYDPLIYFRTVCALLEKYNTSQRIVYI